MTQEKLLKAAGLGHEISAREAWKLFGIMAEFFDATERLAGIRPAVSVFGSARVQPGTESDRQGAADADHPGARAVLARIGGMDAGAARRRRDDRRYRLQALPGVQQAAGSRRCDLRVLREARLRALAGGARGAAQPLICIP